ncbi:5-bromo-4-chloroindolyl phosphate hydrolysis family protein [Gottfriedia acidiceleris]|uniref:5-bromo-4-chloroindolyl phosphate hydrolysis family protein n=1 Tax=Gottfriedia acidiceleris TaxID=371036 RepID=A0ABY4JNP7_9BACI|nr:5-bromo-4-chloroindolyl phosphate hydrolysis family protein [Gottfriedia acidiceleris]UPM55467.1 5-bromo-4-chloroindolyl phosphate hydrolysis family protein [Gottfriedia acidiceleris]
MNRYERIESLIIGIVFMIFYVFIKMDFSIAISLILLVLFFVFLYYTQHLFKKKMRDHGLSRGFTSKWYFIVICFLFIFLYNGILNIAFFERSFLKGSSTLLFGGLGSLIGSFVNIKN